MNRQDITTRALRQIGDLNLTTQAKAWLDEILLEMETVAYWHFLYSPGTPFATSNGIYNYAMPTGYSKGLFLTSSEPRKLIQVPYQQILEMRATLAESDYPKFFCIRDKNNMEVYPTPVTSKLPTLNPFFYRTMSFPGDETTDLYALLGLDIKYHSYLLDGVIWKGFQYIDDNRQDQARKQWENDLLLMLRDNDDYLTTQESKVDRPSLTARLEVKENK